MSRARTPLKIVAPKNDAPAALGAAANHDTPAGSPAGSATQRIVDSITTAIAERRLMPGTKLSEQKILQSSFKESA